MLDFDGCQLRVIDFRVIAMVVILPDRDLFKGYIARGSSRLMLDRSSSTEDRG